MIGSKDISAEDWASALRAPSGERPAPNTLATAVAGPPASTPRRLRRDSTTS
jgi:hypothetical protein